MQVFFEKREELAPTIWQYYFRPERHIDFVAGQYVRIHLPDVRDDPRGPSRVMTLTSLPEDELMSFIVKIPEPHSAYKTSLMALEPGTECKIDDSMGDLILPKDVNQPLVYVAGGIGIASYASMLKELTKRREERLIFLFYALRDRREQILRELYEAYPLALKTIIVSPNRLAAKQIKDSTPPESFIYLSGSQRFVEGLRHELEQLGTLRSQIVFDYYDGYTEL
jgi:ferredoxin-NADP reductase